MLEIKNVTKLYDGVHGVKNINLTVPDGCIYGIIGHNGAGKTTLIKLILGILAPDKSSGTNSIAPNGAMSLVPQLIKKI